MGDIYASESFLQVLFVTGVLGGGAAWLAGRAIAQTWRPAWHAAAYMVLLGCAVRFVHFALFEAELLAPAPFVADTGFLVLTSLLSWRVTRATQMASQYPWLYRRTSPVTWRKRPGTPGESG
jgi:hypothetical protein